MYKKVKSFFDSLVSILVLAFFAPFFVLISIAIKTDSKGPILFLQDRIGMYGKIYKIFKFRSMSMGAEKGGVYETKNDPRVTKVGKIIRKTSIDELPQLINIVRGDMSIIGPRPVLTYHPWSIDEYSVDQKKRFVVKPGVTGWAQINGRKNLEWNKRIAYDIEYVNNLSFKLDFSIFIKTIYKVLTLKDNINTFKTASSDKTEGKL